MHYCIFFVKKQDSQLIWYGVNFIFQGMKLLCLTVNGLRQVTILKHNYSNRNIPNVTVYLYRPVGHSFQFC